MSNYKFKTTNIRGKQYVEVNERIKFFRQEDQYKFWTIASDFPVLRNKHACKCICPEQGKIDGSHRPRYEERISGINNKTITSNCDLAIGHHMLLNQGRHFCCVCRRIQDFPSPASRALQALRFKSYPKKIDAPVENIMDKADGYIKSSDDARPILIRMLR